MAGSEYSMQRLEEGLTDDLSVFRGKQKFAVVCRGAGRVYTIIRCK